MMIPYLGEKSKLSDFILPNIPTDISIYVEPFSGSFGIYFCLDLDSYSNTKFVYNDINYFNYNLFKHLKNQDFVKNLMSIKSTPYLYSLSKEKIFDCSDVDKAIYWLILLTCSESQVDVLNGEWKNDAEFEILKLKLKYNINYFQRIDYIYNSDYKKIIEKYDSEKTFFYVDPPYFKKERYYINHDFTEYENHIELSEILKNIKGKFLLSYLNFPLLYEWYPNFNFKSFNTFMGTEVLIMNY
jgi:DNA adenine methylase